jgi:hypothetical protein
MIQRIQTLWLLFTAFAPLSLIHGGIVNFIDRSGVKFFVGFRGLYQISGSDFEIMKESLALPITLLTVSVLSSVTIILFKFRKIQKVISLIIVAFSLCFLIMVLFYGYQAATVFNSSLAFGFRMIIPLLMVFTSVMAYRGISKDDKLVKSYDRLR